jgi:cellobiose phosphorylase
MLLALGLCTPVRDLLLRVFAAQNPDGDWPQWFMFFERERSIRPNDSHGDIVFWPLLALGRYLLASDDVSILDERVPFFHGDASAAEVASVWDHVERALGVIAARAITGTHLAAYGHGDWNDSLQPVDPAMRERLCSTWTVTLHHETLTTLAEALQVSRPQDAERLHALTTPIRADFQRLLFPGGVLTGFAYFQDEQRVEYLLHPRDGATGIHYRLLPMIHAILNGMLTPAQARRHVGLIKKRLLGPDGARLFDRPPRYQGGPQRHFQRAESSTFFGREIGLMYMHAHLRYAQAMAYYGDVEAFFLALRQANPIALDSVVPTARPRQANCYYSSSDPAFADRYDAAAHYGRLRRGKIPFEGGWRVYSSGAGILLRLIVECLLGVRQRAADVIIDPVMPAALDGLRATVEINGLPITIDYRVGAVGCGPQRLTLNGIELSFEREANPYRTGGAVVTLQTLREGRRAGDNTLTVHLGPSTPPVLLDLTGAK